MCALIRALQRAALWCAGVENHAEIAAIMSPPQYLGHPAALVQRALSGRFAIGSGIERQVADFYLPYARAANFPWKSHALWFYSQMVRWGEMAPSAANAALAAQSFRPDLYRNALLPLGVPIPKADYKSDGLVSGPVLIATDNGPLEMGPDAFFDGKIFDPERLDDYIASQRHGYDFILDI